MDDILQTIILKIWQVGEEESFPILSECEIDLK